MYILSLLICGASAYFATKMWFGKSLHSNTLTNATSEMPVYFFLQLYCWTKQDATGSLATSLLYSHIKWCEKIFS